MNKDRVAVFALLVFVAATDVSGEAEQPRPAQPGATQDGPTTGEEMVPPFDPRYFLGVWEIEWNPPETGLVPAGSYTGTETVTHINNRYLKVDLAMENEDGTKISGQGMIFYEYSLGGQSIVRYVAYDAGFALLQHGPVGGDLGGYHSQFWETPEVMVNDQTFELQGRSYFVSPAAYRVNQQISIDGEEFFNFGVMWLTKEEVGPTGR